ncbi:MAG TPA: hypothetical protein VE954_34420 [Oligoflexus sp.]|uniref:hypothetical protein n=1 Tax=Oligoflexus sp. TaxID=1971216 RepID=UPI002D6B9481|nr:hypothetical protein [Oligoflexus sp.]HYX38225.1 hypothetical protein [Oligoflexus sp.]
MKDKSCPVDDRPFICQWAFDRKEKAEKEPLPADQKELVDQTCAQCEEISKISCVYDFKEATAEFNFVAEIFVKSNDEKKPLVYGFVSPSPKTNNFNLIANMQKLTAENEAYQTELRLLTTQLDSLFKNVSTQEQVRTNIKRVRELTSAFGQKWKSFHGNTNQMAALVANLYNFMADWQERTEKLQGQPGCAPALDQINLAVRDGRSFLDKIRNASDTLGGMDFGNRLRLTEDFAIKSIKLSYVQTSKKPLEDLEASLGSVLQLDQEVMKANVWWIELNRGGLIGGMHTNLYQFEEPMQKLISAVGEGQKFIEKVKSIPGLSKTVVNAAVSKLQLRVDEVQSDLDWLRNRGWQGQLKSQQDSASRMMEFQSDKTTPCAKALDSYLMSARSVRNYGSFQRSAEPKYAQAIQICEAAI